MTYEEARAILPLEHIYNEVARQKALEALDKQIPKKLYVNLKSIIRRYKMSKLSNRD